MLKELLNCKFHLRFVITPYIRYMADNLGLYKGVNETKRDIPIIVSLTSYEERFDDLEVSIYSLLNQTVKPDKLILWLSDKLCLNDLPYNITRFIKNGLEIRFVRDIGSYTKAMYAFKEYSNSIIVTADDDIYYPKDWLAKLYYSFIANPDDINVHRAHRIRICDKKIMPYETWTKHVVEESARFDNFLTGVGGVLYPPNCFSKEVLREDIFLKKSPYADDIWFWVMALVHNRRIRVVKNHISGLYCTDFLRQIFKTKPSLYKINSKGQNDKQLEELLKLYEQNVLPKLID